MMKQEKIRNGDSNSLQFSNTEDGYLGEDASKALKKKRKNYQQVLHKFLMLHVKQMTSIIHQIIIPSTSTQNPNKI